MEIYVHGYKNIQAWIVRTSLSTTGLHGATEKITTCIFSDVKTENLVKLIRYVNMTGTGEYMLMQTLPIYRFDNVLFRLVFKIVNKTYKRNVLKFTKCGPSH
jgi:hypothetical protein